LQSLKVEDLQDLTAKLNENKLTSNGANNPNNKVVMVKRLTEVMTKKGVTEYIASLKLPEKRLRGFFKTLGANAPSDEAKKSEIIALLKNEILYMGLSAIFSNCTVKQLRTYAADLGLTVETNAKSVLLRSILTLKSYTKEDKEKANASRKPKEPRPKVEAGEEDPMAEYVDLPRCPPPKFDWSVSEESDDEMFAEPSQEEEDVEMSDVGSENSESAVEVSEVSSDEGEDGGEYVEKSTESDTDESMEDTPKPRRVKKR